MKKVFYFHIPFCPTWCKFCHFYLKWQKKIWYIDLLKKEYEIRFLWKKQKADCIHIGWWTPNMLNLIEMEDFLKFLNDKLYWFKEFSIELHPALISFELLDLLKKYNVDRLSFGIQTLDLNILKNHTRVDINYKKLWKYICYSKKIWFKKINFDFIYDLIWDSIENIKKNLYFIKKYKPTSIYYYRLRKFTNYLKEKHISNEKKSFWYYLYIKEFFEKNGFYRLNNSVYYDNKQLLWEKPFFYDELIYSKEHSLFWFWVCATTNIWNNFFKNNIDYLEYEKLINNNCIAFDLKFALNQSSYILNKFYFYILQNHTFYIKDFLEEFSFDFILDLKKVIDNMIYYEMITFINWVIKLTEKWHYYIDEKLWDIIFYWREKDFNLLKKL